MVTDSTVEPLYAESVLSELSSLDGEHFLFSFPAGEENKHIDTVCGIYMFLIEHHFDRHDLLIALGGGVTGDITGFAAASYLRGISFVQIPTTLLAQCDSSIGGKTGVDVKGYKNMVGAFYMPRLVWMNLSTLRTLSDRQFAAGFAEVIKHGMIRDRAYFAWLIAHRDGILDRDVETLLPMIRSSSDIKRRVVEEDPRETGLRAILNFGHTIGHAVEKYREFRLYHGECVSLGIRSAAAISRARGYLSAEEEREIVEGLSSFGLPVKDASLSEASEEELLTLIRSDKKMDGHRIRFILLHPLGQAEIAGDVTDEELRLGIRALFDEQA